MVYDCAIIGLGGIGSACAAYLSKEKKVIAIDQYSGFHGQGSSGCESRFFRFSCFEGEEYSNLALRAFDLWRDIERATGIQIFRQTGGLIIGSPDCLVVKNTVAHSSAARPVSILNAREMRREFPAFALPEAHVAVYDQKNGILLPEQAQRAMQLVAKDNGAEVLLNQPVLSVDHKKDRVCLKLDVGVIEAETVVLCCGAWMSQLLPPAMSDWVRAERIVPMWFRPKANSETFDRDRMPLFYWDIGERQIYGVPAVDGVQHAVKVGFDDNRQLTDPRTLDRSVSEEEVLSLRGTLLRYLPDLNGEYLHGRPCMFEMSPDRDFIIGPLPSQPRVFLVGGLSGRGYKFCPAIGEMVADLLTRGYSPWYTERFSPNRLTL